MADQFREVSSQGLFGRIQASIGSVLFGVIFFFGSIVLLYWNEGRAVTTAKALQEGEGAVVSTSADNVDSSLSGKLIHVTGDAATAEVLADPVFGVSRNAIKLRRKVQMYQWAETKSERTTKNAGGGSTTETTYSYATKWAEGPIDSSQFKHPEGHQNPAAWPVQSQTWQAGKVSLGARALSASLVSKMSAYRSLALDAQAAGKLSPQAAGRFKQALEGFYSGSDPGSPKVGDLQVSFDTVDPMTVSVIARQVGATFEPYMTKVGKSLEMLDPGERSAESMFQQAEAENARLTWILRAVGWLTMFLAISAIFKPLVVLADIIPFLGDLLGIGVGLFAFVVSLTLSLIVIAIAWIAFRPVLGSLILAAALAVLVAGVRRAAAAKAAKGPQPAAA